MIQNDIPLLSEHPFVNSSACADVAEEENEKRQNPAVCGTWRWEWVVLGTNQKVVEVLLAVAW